MPAASGSSTFFGEQALITARPRNADVVALGKCRVLVMTQRSFQLVVKQSGVEAHFKNENQKRLELERRGSCAEMLEACGR